MAAINPQDLAVADSNVVVDYFRLSADRRMLFGGRCNYSNRDPTDIGASIRPRMIEIFPQLADAKIDFAWGGRIAIIVDRVPAIGRLAPNLYFLQGYCGHGVNASHIAAEIVSDAICGTTGTVRSVRSHSSRAAAAQRPLRQSDAGARHALLPPARSALERRYQRKTREPIKAPSTVIKTKPIGYQAATNSGLSSVQWLA